ncbi:ABC transporter ATP-binding protein [Geminisphaera colitermitum]|uniref:ABC transporter ATP-binding protein n=1 Tax=Geminisphaera colitermitum TaxID=1148786 RepID=UPI000158D57A|nr:ABC transporter ATP-binding protein [Geminisphaera colitermitum]
MIHTIGLTKSFGHRRVLRGLDFAAESGAITLFIGANGAGKTTTLRLLAGLSAPDAGSIRIAGHDLQGSRRHALACLSYLPQAPRFHPRLTVSQVAMFHARLRGRSPGAASIALDAWGLIDFSDVPTGKLSGGLRQRLGIAVFALADAPVLLLDEPGLSLDPEWREALQDFLTGEARRGRTILMATHLLGEWENRTDRCVLLADGRSGGEIPPGELRRHYHAFLRHILPVPGTRHTPAVTTCTSPHSPPCLTCESTFP